MEAHAVAFLSQLAARSVGPRALVQRAEASCDAAREREFLPGRVPLLVVLARPSQLQFLASGTARRQQRTPARSARLGEAGAAAARGIPVAVPRPLALERVVVIAWLRAELRVHDNPLLVAGPPHASVVPFLCIDPKSGPPEAALSSAATYLRRRLHDAGSNLVVRRGPAPAALAELAGTLAAAGYAVRVECATRGAPDQRREEAAAREALASRGAALSCRVADAIFENSVPVQGTMESFERLREAAARRAVHPSQPRPAPRRLRPLPSCVGRVVPPGDLPPLPPGPSGESEGSALERLELWCRSAAPAPCPLPAASCSPPSPHVRAGGCLCPDFSESLRLGCLSPRLLYAKLDGMPAHVAAPLRAFLLWRDHCLLLHARLATAAATSRRPLLSLA
eukprot:tig00021434_g21358.t1